MQMQQKFTLNFLKDISVAFMTIDKT